MPLNNVFRDVAIESAEKQAVLVDAYTEESPIIANMPMMPSSSPFQNVYENITNITPGEIVEVDGELPKVGLQTELQKQDLSPIGGIIQVGEDKAKAFGGVQAYLDKQLGPIVRETGSENEKSVIYDRLWQYAVDEGKALNAGNATADDNYSLIVVKWTQGENIGIYSPEMFGDGKIFDFAQMGGGLHEFTDATTSKLIIGYQYRMKMYMDVQLANPKHICSIVNIDAGFAEGKVPTATQIDDCIAEARGSAGNTAIYCHPKVFSNVLKPIKSSAVRYVAAENNIQQGYMMWDDIPIIQSRNFLQGTESLVSFS